MKLTNKPNGTMDAGKIVNGIQTIYEGSKLVAFKKGKKTINVSDHSTILEAFKKAEKTRA